MNNQVAPEVIEVFVVIKEGTHQYYLLKVERRDFDVYCFLPDLGVHHSLHCSGESHFRYEGKVTKPGEEPPVALIMGEAGTPIKNGIRSASLRGLGRAAGICTCAGRSGHRNRASFRSSQTYRTQIHAL